MTTYGSASDAPRVSPRLSHPQKLLSLRPFQYTWVSLVGQATRTDPDKTLPTRVPLALLGPCFKTGHRVTTPRQSPGHSSTWITTRDSGTAVKCSPCRTPTPLAEQQNQHGERTEHGAATQRNRRAGSRTPSQSAKERFCTFPFRTNGRHQSHLEDDRDHGGMAYTSPRGTQSSHPRAYLPTTDINRPPVSSQLTVQLSHGRLDQRLSPVRLNSTCSTTTSTP